MPSFGARFVRYSCTRIGSSLPTRISHSWKCGRTPGQVSAGYVADKDQGTKGRDKTTGGPGYSDKEKKQKNKSNERQKNGKKHNIDAKWKRKHHGTGQSTADVRRRKKEPHVREPGQQRTKSERTRKKQQIRATLGKRRGKSARRSAKRLAVGRAAKGCGQVTQGSIPFTPFLRFRAND